MDQGTFKYLSNTYMYTSTVLYKYLHIMYTIYTMQTICCTTNKLSTA
uniref:Uncharacterized protein n=1 Tax=Anguilla anguilla TaxID=7936 RepID=A0A0E9RXT5_ANGAN